MMSLLAIVSVILITLALVFYTIGVWSERISRYLKLWHVAAFWTGLLFDISGTLTMHKLADGPFNLLDPHTLSGQIALWLMFFHAIWASWVLWKGSEDGRKNFHIYGLIVWAVWLIPYFSGMYLGMKG